MFCQTLLIAAGYFHLAAGLSGEVRNKRNN